MHRLFLSFALCVTYLGIAAHTQGQFAAPSAEHTIPQPFTEPARNGSMEASMQKIMTAGLSALFISVSPLAYAQVPAAAASMQDHTADVKAFTEARVELVKLALQLTPTQEKLWPPVEDAIRNRANARHVRLMALAARANDERERSPIEILRDRVDALGQRSANLKKLVDAWQPLYETLDTRQKLRLRVATVLVLREMKDAVASRFWESEDEDENE